MVDSHCHLVDEAYVADLPDVVARARDAGLVEALCVVDPTDAGEIGRLDRLRDLWPAVRTTAGVHPHRAGNFACRVADVTALVRSRLAADPGVRAIGEIGLDYHYDYAPPDVQRPVFEAQLALARELGLPVVIHTREADDDTLAILRGAGPLPAGGVFHCFSGDRVFAGHAVDLGFHVSFSGIVTFNTAFAIQEAARYVPEDRLLVETDCPYLAPAPRRGRRNEPAFVVHVAEGLARLRQADVTDLAAAVTANYRGLFAPEGRPSQAETGRGRVDTPR